jgi:Fe-S oxidoreductase
MHLAVDHLVGLAVVFAALRVPHDDVAAAQLGQYNLDLLRDDETGVPILFLEPSCYSMFVEDYRELKLSEADRVAKRCFLFEKFIEDLLAREPNALKFNHKDVGVAIHAHCHAKSLMNPAFMAGLVSRLPGRKPALLDTGCCGMAGAFGALESKYELSVKVARPLIEKIATQPSGTVVVASGTSCRHQIRDGSGKTALHPVEILYDALLKN